MAKDSIVSKITILEDFMGLALKKEVKYTYQDYLSWDDNERWELIDGTAYNMSPAPGTRHQMVLNNLNIIISRQSQLLKGCQVFIAPTDVVLSIHDVVQPDIFIICDKTKITEKNIQGVPDLIIEVLSPTTALKDKREKKALYERYGVREYIIVDPIGVYVERYVLGDDLRYGIPEILGYEERLSLKSFEGIEIMLTEVLKMEF